MGQNNTPFQVNGYSYADGRFTFNGIDIAGIKAFNYKVTKTKTNNYGLGENPESRTKGKKEYSGSMDMTPSAEKILIDNFSPSGLLVDVPAGTAVFSVVREDGGKEVVNMPFFEFQSEGFEGSEGDEDLSTSNDVIFGGFVRESY